MASFGDVANLSNRMRRHHVSDTKYVRHNSSVNLVAHDARNARAENGLRHYKSSRHDSWDASGQLGKPQFPTLHRRRSVDYGRGIKVPDCMPPPSPAKPVMRLAKLEFLSAPKMDLTGELERRETIEIEKTNKAREEHLCRWTLSKREELKAWRQKRDAIEAIQARQKHALEKETRRYKSEINKFVLNKAQKEMDVFATRRRLRFERATARANTSSFGRHRHIDVATFFKGAVVAVKKEESV